MWFPLMWLGKHCIWGVGPFDGRVEYFPLIYLFYLCILSMPFSLVYSPYLLGERFMFLGFWLDCGFHSICNSEQGFKIFK